MLHFCTAIIEFILICTIIAPLIGCNLPSFQDLHNSRVLKGAGKIMVDPFHPGQKLFGKTPPLVRGFALSGPKALTTRKVSSQHLLVLSTRPRSHHWYSLALTVHKLLLCGNLLGNKSISDSDEVTRQPKKHITAHSPCKTTFLNFVFRTD